MAIGGVRKLAGWVAQGVGTAVDDTGDRLRGIWGDDDPDGEELQPLPEIDDAELDELDDPHRDVDAPLDLEHPDEASLPRLLGRLDPAPPLPLTEPFHAGLGPLLRRWIDAEPVGVLADRRVDRVLDLLGSRFTIEVSREGITVTGLVRRRHTPWDRVQEVRLEPRSDLFADRVVAGTVAMLVGRGLLPIPGLGWLLRGVIGLLEQLIPDRWTDSMRHESGDALASIRRSMARDVELAGPLALVAFLSHGLTAAVTDEAGRRDLLTTT